MSRAIIVGMNNPLSENPRAALMPYPKNSAGWRLWKMFHDVTGLSRAEYMRGFERVNLCDSRDWDPKAARSKAEALWPRWGGRTVVICGRAVQQVLWLQPRATLAYSVREGVRWCYILHPSGLSREYNDERMRLVVGLRLEELYHNGGQHAGT